MKLYRFKSDPHSKIEFLGKEGSAKPSGGKKVGLEESIPPFLVREIRPVLAKHINVIPSWCNELIISWRPEPSEDPEIGVDRPFECRPITRYARAIIWVSPAAAGLCPRLRARGILHELCHLQLAPIQRKMQAFWEAGPSDQANQRWLVDTVEQTIESLVNAYLEKRSASFSPEQRHTSPATDDSKRAGLKKSMRPFVQE